jgi:hypothetical protein
VDRRILEQVPLPPLPTLPADSTVAIRLKASVLLSQILILFRAGYRVSASRCGGSGHSVVWCFYGCLEPHGPVAD